MVVARAIRAERARAGMTQAQLGEKLGWARSTVAVIEAGERPLQVHELPAVCRVLDVTFDELVRKADPADRAALGL